MAFTYFFRDAQTLELALDQAIDTFRDEPTLRIWDAGCAHGPESYTIAMLLHERLSPERFEKVRILATDVDNMFAATVSTGIFPEPQIRRVQPEFQQKYFTAAAAPGHVQIIPELRARVAFAHHDLLSLQPFVEGLHLVVCKNVLLHFAEEQRVQVLQMFSRALRPGGLLAMEHTQKLPETLRTLFEPTVSHAQVYRRLPGASVGHPTTTTAAAHSGPPQPLMNRLLRRLVSR